MNKKEYETKPMVPEEKKTIEAAKFTIAEEKPKVIVPNRCVLGACGEKENIVRQEYNNTITITCLKCGYVAKFIDGKII